MRNPVQSPCRNCENRHMGCHGQCERYNEYKIRHDEVQEKIRKADDEKNAIWEYHDARFKRLRRSGKNE